MFGFFRRREYAPDPEQAAADRLFDAEERARETRLAREALFSAIEDQRNGQASVLYEAAKQAAVTDEATAIALIKQAALSKISAHAAREARYMLSVPSDDELLLGARLLGSLGSAPAVGSKISKALGGGKKVEPEADEREDDDAEEGDTTPFPKRGPAGGSPRKVV